MRATRATTRRLRLQAVARENDLGGVDVNICDHCLKGVDTLWKTRVRLNLVNLDESARHFVRVDCCAGCYKELTGHEPDQRSRRIAT